MPKFIRIIVLNFLLAFLFNLPVFSQEVQISILPEKHIDYIDANLQKKFNLFSDYQHFREARIFQLPDSSYVMEILYQKNGKPVKERKTITAADIQQLRQKLLARLQKEQQKPKLDQSGRTKLLIASTTLSIGFYGWAVPEVLNIQDEKLGVATYMFSAGAGFLVPYFTTKNRSVTRAAATLAVYGATRGIWHGYLLSKLFANKPSSRLRLTTMMLSSIGEGFLGYALATKKHYSTGRVETMGTTGDFGLLLGVYAGVLGDFYDDGIGRKASVSMLLGSGLGVWAGKLLSDHYTYSRGDARVLEACGLLGAYIPFTLVDWTNIDFDKRHNRKIFFGSSLIGTLVGLGIAHHLLRDKNFSYSQGVFVELGELTGGLLGFGLAYLVTPSSAKNRDKIYLTASSLGATAGFFLMYKSFAPSARLKVKSSAIKLSLHPESLFGLMMKNRQRDDLRLPVASLQVRF